MEPTYNDTVRLPRPARAPRPIHVVIFERDAVARTWLAARVTARGHTVTALESADGIASLYDAEHPLLLLLDWSSSEGAALSRRIRASWPWGRCVILATGLSDRASDLAAALDAGADDCLSKPVDAGSLEARLLVAERRVLQLEERLQSEKRLHLLQHAVDTLPLGVSVADENGRILYMNQADAGIHSYRVDGPPDPPAGLAPLLEGPAALSPDDLRKFREWNGAHLRLRKQETAAPARVYSETVRDAAGAPVGEVTVCEGPSPSWPTR